MKRNKAFFFDRDGILVHFSYDKDSGVIDTVSREEDIEFVFGIFDVLKHTSKLGYLNVLVSNQPGLALNKLSEEKFDKIRTRINEGLAKEGIKIDAEYYCFHHPFAKNERYREDCDCHKPKPGLIHMAAKDLRIDLSNSWMLGDGVGDVLAGNAAGVKTILLGSIEQGEYIRIIEKQLGKIKPDFLIKKLPEVMKIVKS